MTVKMFSIEEIEAMIAQNRPDPLGDVRPEQPKYETIVHTKYRG